VTARPWKLADPDIRVDIIHEFSRVGFGYRHSARRTRFARPCAYCRSSEGAWLDGRRAAFRTGRIQICCRFCATLPFVVLLEQLGERDLERTRDADQRCDGRVRPRTLDVLPVLLIEPRELRGLSLRQLALKP